MVIIPGCTSDPGWILNETWDPGRSIYRKPLVNRVKGLVQQLDKIAAYARSILVRSKGRFPTGNIRKLSHPTPAWRGQRQIEAQHDKL